MIGVWVPLTGKVGAGICVLVDRHQAESVMALPWYIHRPHGSRTRYARTTVGRKTIYLHRFVFGAAPGHEIDHIDGDGLNNMLSNLQAVSHAENIRHGYIRRAFDEWEHAL